MGRGQNTPLITTGAVSRTAAEAELTGQALVDAVYLARSAVDNWVRFTQGPRELTLARGQLLDAIRDQGVWSADPPNWMTSAKPGISAYIHLETSSLTLVPDEKNHRQWLASNCIAPRRRPGRRQEKIEATTRQGGLSQESLIQARQLNGPALAAACRFSRHCLDRLGERAGTTGDLETAAKTLQQLISDSGRVVATPPAWANASRAHEPTLLVDHGSDQLAFPITDDLLPARSDDINTGRFVLSTCISQHWAENAVTTLQGTTLRAAILIPSHTVQAWQARKSELREEAAFQELEHLIITDGHIDFVPPPGQPAAGAWLHLRGEQAALQLRPVSSTHVRPEQWITEAVIEETNFSSSA